MLLLLNNNSSLLTVRQRTLLRAERSLSLSPLFHFCYPFKPLQFLSETHRAPYFSSHRVATPSRTEKESAEGGNRESGVISGYPSSRRSAPSALTPSMRVGHSSTRSPSAPVANRIPSTPFTFSSISASMAGLSLRNNRSEERRV